MLNEQTNNSIREWEIGEEFGNPILKTKMKGSFLYKITDNEKDAQNTLENIRANP